ncbi:MAG: (2Fe-2S)-binding protein, partial [Pseudomonadota bacterium]
LAGKAPASDWEVAAREMFHAPHAEVSSIIDHKRGSARIVLQQNGELVGALFVSPTPVAVMRDYLADLPGTDGAQALMGRPAADAPNPGPVLCSCFGIGINTIATAIETQGLMSVDAIGEALSAGTNCGSCRPEIAELLQAVNMREAAE